MWQWLRRLAPDLETLAAMSWYGCVIPLPSLFEQADSAAENDTPDSEPAMPPDHFDRPADGEPLTSTEREQWERLRGNW
jgi:hypothetical protein